MSHPGSGGLSVPPAMLKILQRNPGYISSENGGQRLADMYVDGSKYFNPYMLSDFALACYLGSLDKVKHIVESNNPPYLAGNETPYQHSYASLIVLGSQRVEKASPMSMKWAEVLEYLFSKGLPPDVPDIFGYTALHHATMTANRKIDIARILLNAGADVNYQNRRGMPPIMATMLNNITDALDLFMEFGADLDVKDADGYVPRKTYVDYGPQVAATVEKWLRKRKGETAPMEDKCGYEQCPNTSTLEKMANLKSCARCKTMRYCSTKCQREHWPQHKTTCKSLSESSTVTLKPHYEERITNFFPTASITRNFMPQTTTEQIPHRHFRAWHVPKSLSEGPKSVIVKVQVPPSSNGAPLLVYTRKRDFVCIVLKGENAREYDRISAIIRSKGVMGLKAYFSAELRSKDQLVVNVEDVLAAQPW